MITSVKSALLRFGVQMLDYSNMGKGKKAGKKVVSRTQEVSKTSTGDLRKNKERDLSTEEGSGKWHILPES